MKLVIALLIACGSVWAQCEWGSALRFDGINDFVQIADAYFDSQETTAFTVECRFQTSNDDQQYGAYIWNKTAYWKEAYLSYCCDRSFSFMYAYPYAYNNAYSLNVESPTGQWHHLAASMENSVLRLFLNGHMLASSGTNGTMSWATDAGTNRIGSGIVSGSSYYFSGMIDEMRFSSVARYTTDFSVPTEPFLSDSYTEALYHFDEGTGNVLTDESGHGHHGSLVNGPLWICADDSLPLPENPCPGGSALLFNGCTNYVMVPHSPSMDLNNQMTIECWYRRDGGSCNDVEYFLTKFVSDHACPPTGWYLRAGCGGACIGGGLLQPPACQEIGLGCTPGQLSSWRHLAMCYDGAELRFYVDGQLYASRFESRPIANNTSPIWIGAQNDAYWGRVLNGALDEIRISSVSRYSSNFDPAVAPYSPDANTVCLFHFDEGSGNVLHDASGNGNHGTLVNNPQWICSDAPLPVELLSFDARAEDESVVLSWVTGSESEMSHFEIERDGMHVAEVTATNAAAGNSYQWRDEALENGREYFYTLTSVDLDGTREVLGQVTAAPRADEIPSEFVLLQNYPNPFNASTTIEFVLPEVSDVTLTLHNLLGEVVATISSGAMSAGVHRVNFDAGELSSGIYFYRLQAGEKMMQKKMAVIR